MAIPDLVEDSSACHLVVHVFTPVRFIAQKNLPQKRSGYDRAVSSFSCDYAHVSLESFGKVPTSQRIFLGSDGNCVTLSNDNYMCEA